MSDGLDPNLQLLAYLGSFGVAVSTVTALILNALKKNRDVFWRAMDGLRKEMRRHDLKDDRRFAEIDRKVWSIQFRNSKKDGTPTPPLIPITNQIYGLEDDEDETGE